MTTLGLMLVEEKPMNDMNILAEYQTTANEEGLDATRRVKLHTERIKYKGGMVSCGRQLRFDFLIVWSLGAESLFATNCFAIVG